LVNLTRFAELLGVGNSLAEMGGNCQTEGMSDAPPIRRSFSFSLRTLLVFVSLAAISLGFVGYNLNWIRQRQAFRAAHTPPVKPAYPLPPHAMGPCIVFEYKAPWSLRLFGESGGLSFERRKLSKDELEEGKRLFPEVNWGEQNPPTLTAIDLRPFA
jgi:hypothetical protein